MQMNDFNNKDKTRLEKIQKKLYEKNFVQEKTKRHSLDNKNYNLNTDWEDKSKKESEYKDFSDFIDEKKKKRIGFFGYTMILAFIFFLASISYAGYIFLCFFAVKFYFFHLVFWCICYKFFILKFAV